MTPSRDSFMAYVAFLVAHPWLVVGATLVVLLCVSLAMLWKGLDNIAKKEDE